MTFPCRHRWFGLLDVSSKWRGVPGVVRDIFNQENGTLYLRRIYLLPWLFLHKIVQADGDRHMHNHPWTWAFSWILWGGYIEQRPEGYYERLLGDEVWLGPRTFHRIVWVQRNTWSLFLTGRSTQTWGFATEKGFVDFQSYFSRS